MKEIDHKGVTGIEEGHNLRDVPIFLREETSAGTSMLGLIFITLIGYIL